MCAILGNGGIVVVCNNTEWLCLLRLRIVNVFVNLKDTSPTVLELVGEDHRVRIIIRYLKSEPLSDNEHESEHIYQRFRIPQI